MRKELKLRLIGFSAILLSAVIIFPLFFSGDGYKERHMTSAIPEPPQVPVVIQVAEAKPALPSTIEIADPVPKKVVITRPKPVEVAVVKAKPAVVIEKDAPTLDQQGVPVAWTLQLASFKDETNARGLRKQLVSAGHKVYTRKLKGLVKVYVGPDLQRTNLERLKRDLKENMGLDGIIVRFTTL